MDSTDSMEISEDLVLTPSEKEVLTQYALCLEQWGHSWKLCRLTASLDVALQVCGQRPLHPDRTVAEEAAIWQHFADENGGDDAALGELGPKPTADAYPDAAEHDARARTRRDNFMRKETTKNQTPKTGGVPGTLRDDGIVPPTDLEPAPMRPRTTFEGYPSPAAAAPAPTAPELAAPAYETLNFGDDESPLLSADELAALNGELDTGEPAPAPTPRTPFVQNVPRADIEDSLVGLQRAALEMEAQDVALEPDESLLNIHVAEQAIEYQSPDPPVAAPDEEDIPPPDPDYRPRSRSNIELRLLLGAAAIGFVAFLMSQLLKHEPARLTQLPDAPAVCLLPQALDRLPSAEQMRYIDCQLPHEARPSFHCRAPNPNTEAAQVDLCTRAWRACAPPFGTAISPEAQAYCLARVAPPSPLRP